MILPNLLPRHRSRRDYARHAHMARQMDDLPGQFTTPVRAGGGDTGDNSESETTGRQTSTSASIRTTPQIGETARLTTTTGASTSRTLTSSSLAEAIPTVVTMTSASSNLTSSTSQAVVVSVTATRTAVHSASTSRDLIFVTTFPADFPIPGKDETQERRPGRGYVFIPDSQLADSMLLFATFCAGFFVFTILLIKLTRLSERRNGNHKTDQMVGEDMRWAEGREVVEKRIVWDGSADNGGQVPPVPVFRGATKGGGKLARRQSWGDKQR